MTLDEWLTRRDPAPPPALASRLTEMTRSLPADTPQRASDALLGAAEHILTDLLPAGCGSRASAIDLLVADALVTYAFEAAADAPDMLEHQATMAMSRLAAFAGVR